MEILTASPLNQNEELLHEYKYLDWEVKTYVYFKA